MPPMIKLTPVEFAQRWNVSTRTVHRWVREGHIPTVPMEDWQTPHGRQSYLIPVAAAEQAIRKHAHVTFGRSGGRRPRVTK